VRTADPLPSAGVQTVRATLERTVRRRCATGRCNAVRRMTLRATRLGPTTFRLRTRTLPRTRYTLVVAALDGAGHLQRVPRRLRFVVR
jgi:hypothetical protein